MSSKNKFEDVKTLHEKLRSLRARKGIIGYILRDPNSASIDLRDPKKIIEYALLSTTAFEAGQEMSALFEIGKIDTILLEGENTKSLSLAANDHRLSIFMEKSVDHNRLCKEMNLR